MDLVEFAASIKAALNSNLSVVFACNCVVNYSGRAESYLPSGDRIVIIKPDKTLIIHQSNGSNPVNYMKADTNHSIITGKGGVILKSTNLKESMHTEVQKVHFFHAHLLNDTEKIRIVGTERDMANHLVENPSLVSKDFKPLSTEEHTKYGFIDVFGYDANNNLVVVECKRYVGNLNAVTQLRRYVEKIKKAKGLTNVKGVLACPRISPNALKMLTDWGFEFVSLKPPRYLERFDKHQRKLDF